MIKFKKIILMVFVFLFIANSIFISYCFCGDYKMNTEEIAKFDIKICDVDRICVKTNKNSHKPYQQIDITQQETIKSIINELILIKPTGGIDTIVDYDVIFYKEDQALLVLGLKIDLKYPSSSFIRHRRPDSVNDYIIGKSFYDFFVRILKISMGTIHEKMT